MTQSPLSKVLGSSHVDAYHSFSLSCWLEGLGGNVPVGRNTPCHSTEPRVKEAKVVLAECSILSKSQILEDEILRVCCRGSLHVVIREKRLYWAFANSSGGGFPVLIHIPSSSPIP